jgi:transcriptional regulator with XRE-family HTH domain
MPPKAHTEIEQFIIDTVRQKRIEKNMSQRDLANLIGLSASFIGDIENPNLRAKYNLNHINELAKVFDCSPKDFLPEQPFGEL